jgi:hypothetical protein
VVRGLYFLPLEGISVTTIAKEASSDHLLKLDIKFNDQKLRNNYKQTLSIYGKDRSNKNNKMN